MFIRKDDITSIDINSKEGKKLAKAAAEAAKAKVLAEELENQRRYFAEVAAQRKSAEDLLDSFKDIDLLEEELSDEDIPEDEEVSDEDIS